MALNNIAKFNWEKIVTKVDNPEILRSLNILRAKANEILATSAKLEQEPAKIDFESYKNKLKFTGSAVTTLEKVYKSKTLPTYTATVPAFEVNKRQQLLVAVKQVVEAAKADIEKLNAQLDEFEKTKITKDTTYAELSERYPQIAKEIEVEVHNHQWSK